MITTVLTSVPTEILEEEVSKRRTAIRKRLGKRYGRYALTVKVSRCLGCGKDYSARDMRKHKCSIGYNRRIGKVYDKKKKKYVFPEDLSK